MHALPKSVGPSPRRRSTAIPFATACLLLWALGLGSGCSDQAHGQGLVIQMPSDVGIGPGMELDTLRMNYHSFGRVPLGDKVSHVFLLKNTDSEPLTVTRMKPACGCTSPSISYMADGEPVLGRSALTREPEIIRIPPGVTAELKITMDTHSVPVTNVDKTVGVMLTTDSPNGFYLHVETHIFVEKPFTQNPSGINFASAAANGTTFGSTDLILNSGYNLSLTGIASMPEGMQADLILDPSGMRIWTLKATLLPPHELGNWYGSIFVNQVSASGEELEPLEVRMRAAIVEDLICTPSRMAFGTVREDYGTRGGLTIKLKTLLRGHRFGIEELILPEDHRQLFDLSFVPIAPDAEGLASSWEISMSCQPGIEISQLTSGSIRAILFDPQHPEASIDYVVHPPRE